MASLARPKAHPEPLTILESLTTSLPKLDRNLSKNLKASPSATSTLETTHPKFWVARDVDDYVRAAEALLPDGGAVQKFTSKQYAPAEERSFCIQTEGDVVRASALYLLHPVNMVLEAMFPDDNIRCFAEDSQNTKHPVLPTQTTRTRPDILYKKNGKTVAILEYKLTSIMKVDEFEAARIRPSASPDDVLEVKALAEEDPQNRSLFESDSAMIVKQVTKYVEHETSTRYAALFDWDQLFLSVYDEQDHEMIYGTLVSSRDKAGTEIRKALLGWLIEAITNDGSCMLNYPWPSLLGNAGGGSRQSGSRSLPRLNYAEDSDENNDDDDDDDDDTMTDI